MFLRKALGERESQAAELFMFKTLGMVPAPSPQTVPKILFF